MLHGFQGNPWNFPHARSEDSNVVVGLPVLLCYDCVYDSAIRKIYKLHTEKLYEMGALWLKNW